jgi:hypothetical protein
VEEPPKESTDAKVSKLDPLICQVCGVDAEVTKDKGGNHHCSEETYIKGVHYVVNISFVLLEQHVRKSPAYDAKDTINIGREVVIGEI